MAGPFGSLRADEPVAVSAGKGSYASFPPAQEDQGRNGDKVADMPTRPLYIDASLAGEPVPTNQWWTNLIVDQYAGTMWAYPFSVGATAHGIKIFLPMGWNEAGNDMQTGPALEVLGDAGENSNAARLLADFEGDHYADGWMGSGNFGEAPAQGKFPNQTPVSNYVGKGLANSCNPDDATEGELTSGEFVIDRKFLTFLVGGGDQPQDLYIRLLVDGNEVRRATGHNTESMSQEYWDVSEFQGKKGVINIADMAHGGWGHILVDQIMLTDQQPVKGQTPEKTSFVAESAVASHWSDWLVQARLKAKDGGKMDATFGHGLPYVWVELEGIAPVLKLPAGATVSTLKGEAFTFPGEAQEIMVAVEGRKFVVYLPSGTKLDRDDDLIKITHTGAGANYVVVGAGGDAVDLGVLTQHARMVPRSTRLDWTYDPAKAQVETKWVISGTALEGAATTFLQGWIAHHYLGTTNDLKMAKVDYQTARGLMHCAEGNEFHITYPFEGIMPNPPLNPKAAAKEYPWDAARMSFFIKGMADRPEYGGDTYWGGKDIMRLGQYLVIAEDVTDPNVEAVKKRCEQALVDWLTYTPGEAEHYFARYDRWKALIGFNDSYGSFQFTDNHFHYGYFTTAGAYLSMYDKDFASGYKPMLELVAKQYANWDRSDKNFPFLRTFDIWAGHSHAGGFSSPGGNNQESSSEAMQSWGGLFLLGAVLQEDGMRDAGAMGFAMERAATMTYWNNYHAWKNGKAESVFPAAYKQTIVGILFDGGQAFGTFFSGDPGWIYGIQWLPVSPIIEYLAEDPEFAKYQDGQMVSFREKWLQTEAEHKGQSYNPEDNTIVGMGNALGNVILGYRALFAPDEVLKVTTELWTQNHEIAKDLNQGGLVYYYAQAYRQLGTRVAEAHGSIPTSAVYFNRATKTKTYTAYNPGSAPADVIFTEQGQAVGHLTVPPGQTISSNTLKP